MINKQESIYILKKCIKIAVVFVLNGAYVTKNLEQKRNTADLLREPDKEKGMFFCSRECSFEASQHKSYPTQPT